MRTYSIRNRCWVIDNKNIEHQNKIIDNYRYQLSEYFKQYNYHWFVTLKSHQYDIEDCELLLKIWNRKMSIQNHIQTSYVGLFVCSPCKGNHVHLLMMGKNKYGDTLLDIDKSQWEREWDYIVTHKPSSRLTNKQIKKERVEWDERWKKPYHSKIILVTTETVTGYISCYKNTPVNHYERFELLKSPNKKLLEKFKIVH